MRLLNLVQPRVTLSNQIGTYLAKIDDYTDLGDYNKLS